MNPLQQAEILLKIHALKKSSRLASGFLQNSALKSRDEGGPAKTGNPKNPTLWKRCRASLYRRMETILLRASLWAVPRMAYYAGKFLLPVALAYSRARLAGVKNGCAKMRQRQK